MPPLADRESVLRAPTPRLYALSGAAWTAVGASLALVGVVQIVLRGALAAPLGVGRLHLAYLGVVPWGAVALPLAGYLLSSAREGSAESDRGGPARWGLLLWNGGLALGLVAVLAGHPSPTPWFPLPALSYALVAVGAGAWSYATWQARATVGTTLPLGLALPALVSGPVWLVVGGVLAAPLGGAAGELAAITAARGALALWLLPLAAATATDMALRAAQRPPYGRRLLLVGGVVWLACAPLAGIGAAGADLLPAWLQPLGAAAAAALVVPAVLLGASLLGTWVGCRGDQPRSPALLATLGLALAVGATMAASMAWAVGAHRAAWTGWDPWAALFPPLAGLWLVAVAAGASMRPECALARVRQAAPVAAAWAVAAVATPWAASLALAAAPGALVPSVALRIPWAVLGVAVAGLGLVRARQGEEEEEATAVEGLHADEAEMAAPAALPHLSRQATSWVAGGTVAAVALALTAGVFLPVADPGAAQATPRTAARVLAGGGPRDRGRAVYVATGCQSCHTQRVVAGDAGWGPETRRSDYPPGAPALAGMARLGPDLAWVGERYPSPELMAAALAVHGPRASGGVVPLPWLFGPRSGREGRALEEYLLGLTTGGTS